jgi:micrococcal nuclease
MHEYRVKIRRIVDGDTVDVDIDLGFGHYMHKQRIRLFGIDTPESRTRDKVEKVYGNIAKAYLKARITDPDVPVKLRTHLDTKGKYGRILGEFIVTDNANDRFPADVNVNEEMIQKHLGVRYYGQAKEDIAEEHIKNRELVDNDRL